MNARAVTKIVRSVVGKQATIYNDKLKNGVRSIKLEIWSIDVNGTYELPSQEQWTMQVGAALQAAGYTVDIVTTSWGSTRLHVA